MDKTEEALGIIEKALALTVSPVVMCSFGKDSLTMLDMVREFVPDVDVIYFSDDCHFPEKHLHALHAVCELGIKTPISYPPSSSDYFQKDDFFDVVHLYYIDGKSWYLLYNGCRKYEEGEKFSCAKDLMAQPTISDHSFPWDCVFHGQKECESLHVSDSFNIPSPIVPFGKGIMVMPIYNWSDEEVLNYARVKDLPVNWERYIGNPSGGPKSVEQDRLNSDVIPVCYNCYDENNIGKEVHCPLSNKPVAFCGKTREENAATIKTFLGEASYLKCSDNT